MLTSLALIFLVGMALGWVFSRLRLPSLLGMLLTGILLGPYVLNLLDDSILGISADLRQLALIIILTRAGLSLQVDDLKKVGRPAVLMCFLPACFEVAGMLLLAPALLGISLLDAAIMGAVVAAVSPAVVVPRMLKLMEEGYGTNHGIPQLILAGASVDDVFVIVLFTSFTGLAQGVPSPPPPSSRYPSQWSPAFSSAPWPASSLAPFTAGSTSGTPPKWWCSSASPFSSWPWKMPSRGPSPSLAFWP